MFRHEVARQLQSALLHLSLARQRGITAETSIHGVTRDREAGWGKFSSDKSGTVTGSTPVSSRQSQDFFALPLQPMCAFTFWLFCNPGCREN
jgi:hypothetical protein